MEGKRIKRVMFNGKCIMEYDFSPIFDNLELSAAQEDAIYSAFSIFWDELADHAFDISECGIRHNKLIDEKTSEIWAGNEALRELYEKEHERIFANCEGIEERRKCSEELERVLHERMSSEEYEIVLNLQDKEVELQNEYSDDFNRVFIFKSADGYEDFGPFIY